MTYFLLYLRESQKTNVGVAVNCGTLLWKPYLQYGTDD